MAGDVFHIDAGRAAYDVHVGEGNLAATGALVGAATEFRRCALVSDDVVGGLYSDAVMRSLDSQGFDVADIRIPSGEPSKSWREAGLLLERLAAGRFGRDTVVVALGGGVVGDLAGFVAAVFNRGVPVAHVPTTLLAQVDSSIGGKTGVDLPQGKNLAGAFWSPLVVVSDVACLSTLPGPEWRSGLAEVAKSAVLDGESAFAGLETDADALGAREPEAIMRGVLMAAGLKARVVDADERETGLRESLNYGHTMGHAIERVAGFGTVAHGVAVGEGMRFAAIVAEEATGADPAWSERQGRLLTRLGLPPTAREWDVDELISAMYADKKVRGGVVRMVLSPAPGEWTLEPVGQDLLADVANKWATPRQGGEAS